MLKYYPYWIDNYAIFDIIFFDQYLFEGLLIIIFAESCRVVLPLLRSFYFCNYWNIDFFFWFGLSFIGFVCILVILPFFFNTFTAIKQVKIFIIYLCFKFINTIFGRKFVNFIIFQCPFFLKFIFDYSIHKFLSFFNIRYYHYYFFIWIKQFKKDKQDIYIALFKSCSNSIKYYFLYYKLGYQHYVSNNYLTKLKAWWGSNSI